jgi:hypothetical protein
VKDLIERYMRAMPRNTGEGVGGGGDGSSPAAAANIPDGGAGDPPPAGDGGDSAGGSGGDGLAPPAEAYFPEGLADNLKGTNDRETIDKLAGALKGYRERDTHKDVPEAPEGYFSIDGIPEQAFKLDDRFKAHFENFGTDPGMKAAAAIAQKHGVSRPVFLEAMQASMSALSEAGILEPMLDTEAERAALLPETHKNAPKAEQDKAIDARMNDNLAFLDLMASNKGLPKEAAEYASLMLADSAKGHQFLEWLRGSIQGGDGTGPGAHGGNGGGSITHSQLKERQADPRNNPSDLKYDAGFAAETTRLYKQFAEAGGTFEG